MKARAPIVISLTAAAIMFGSIAFVGTLVVIGVISGGMHFPGGPEIADASAMLAGG